MPSEAYRQNVDTVLRKKCGYCTEEEDYGDIISVVE